MCCPKYLDVHPLNFYRVVFQCSLTSCWSLAWWLLMRRMSSASLRVGEVRVAVVLDEADSLVVSLPLFSQWFHDDLQERFEQERAESISLFGPSLEVELSLLLGRRAL